MGSEMCIRDRFVQASVLLSVSYAFIITQGVVYSVIRKKNKGCVRIQKEGDLSALDKY